MEEKEKRKRRGNNKKPKKIDRKIQPNSSGWAPKTENLHDVNWVCAANVRSRQLFSESWLGVGGRGGMG